MYISSLKLFNLFKHTEIVLLSPAIFLSFAVSQEKEEARILVLQSTHDSTARFNLNNKKYII